MRPLQDLRRKQLTQGEPPVAQLPAATHGSAVVQASPYQQASFNRHAKADRVLYSELQAEQGRSNVERRVQ